MGGSTYHQGSVVGLSHALPSAVGRARLETDGGQMGVKWRSNGGQMEVKWRSNGGQIEAISVPPVRPLRLRVLSLLPDSYQPAKERGVEAGGVSGGRGETKRNRVCRWV